MSEQGTAIVTGGSRGLGLKIVEHFAERGFRVVTCSRKPTSALDELRARFDIEWHSVDAASPTSRAEMADIITAAQPHLLINNIGSITQGLFISEPQESLETVVATNYIAPMVFIQAAARSMVGNGIAGQIVNVSSINTIRGYRGVASYASAKAGIDGLVRPLAREFGPFGIRINSVVPGYFDSDLTAVVTDDHRTQIRNRTPLGRLGTTDDVVGAINYLTSEPGTFITGQTLVIDGGITC
ncbi:SDR family NAD(P)-dependent oxidoreductase [Rhodococcus sp. IEGM 1330]|uniref:SDR family NAD(P)-dependent oxidoreductase n=1 Tax=Rhodococcus sp. IEGM 1330 TaxID=3082225 RepID=UPI002953A946|nr:SDR family oxidoreductase [Rhodococcus sp. IEGM 1330]MDV8022705.1 SDR family oxidoreductase [Rhodococcus sp. IEGM 1330]